MTRQEIIKAIETCYEVGHGCTECPLFSEDECNCNDKLMHDVLALLKEQPEVVLCEDCKFSEKRETCNKEYEYKCYRSEYEGCFDYHHKNWFCADGKRKEVVIIEQQ